MRYVIVFDTETTGLPQHEWASVTSFGAVVLDWNHDIVHVESMKVRPTVLDERAHAALAMQRVSAEEIAAHPHSQDDLAALVRKMNARWTVESPEVRPPLWTAYNVEFDKEMLRRAGAPIDMMLWGRCCLAVAQEALGMRYRPRLAAAATQLGVAVHETHEAVSDALLTAAVLRRSVPLLKQKVTK